MTLERQCGKMCIAIEVFSAPFYDVRCILAYRPADRTSSSTITANVNEHQCRQSIPIGF